MRHLGDITKIHGGDVPTVNVVIGGSPCQDLSIAGKRRGLAGERSGLFMEQLRVIKEMRKKDAESGRHGNEIRPRFMVWENVPGAFSSNQGADFGAVLQETIRVVCQEAPAVPMPKNGWPTAGCLSGMDERGNQWSVAWRVFDAQFWGVPQRRRRIALIADFGGLSAPEILFERKSVSRDTQSCGTTGEETAGFTEKSPVQHDSLLGVAPPPCTQPITLKIRGGCNGGGKGSLLQFDKSATLSTLQDQTLFQPILHFTTGGYMSISEDQASTLLSRDYKDPPCVAYSFDSLASNSMKSTNPFSGCREVDKSCTLDTSCPDPSKNQGGIAILQPITLQQNASGEVRSGFTAGTIGTNSNASGRNTPIIAHPQILVVDADCRNGTISTIATTLQERTGQTLNAGGVIIAPSYCIQGNCIDRADTAGCNGAGWTEDKSYTLNTIDRPAVAHLTSFCFDARGNGDHENRVTDYTALVVKALMWIVRRLTPLECERLQGFPDGWTNIGAWIDSKGKMHKESDTTRYKALGNSIALPSWYYVLLRLSLFCGSENTMASLFDGIGGFPLIWETINGKNTCLWASEIEEFPIAVTRLRFPEQQEQA